MNKTISTEEILSLYKKCGISPNASMSNRTQINTGTLGNKLNYFFSAKINHTAVLPSNISIQKK